MQDRAGKAEGKCGQGCGRNPRGDWILMIDLHPHTTFPDGTADPAELLNAAGQTGLRALAITDHDTLAGFDAALPHAAGCGVELVCGIELSTQFGNDDCGGARGPSIHVLGYFLRGIPDEEFRSWLVPISATRRSRNLELMEKLRASNIDISWQEFPGLGPELAARSHFARGLVKKGCVPDLQSAFDLYLSDAVLAGRERKLPSTLEAVDQVRRQGGIASLAHPGRLRCRPSALRSFVDELIRGGLCAIEAYHSDHTPEETAAFLQIASETGLLVTGGSHFFGGDKPGIRLWVGGNGEVFVLHDVVFSIEKQPSPSVA